MKKVFIFLALSALVLTSNRCSKKPVGEPGPNEIWLEYKAFHPSQRKVAVGTTITFINKDNADHTATATDHLFDSGKIKSGNSYSYTFNTAGTYYFVCNYHSSNSSEQGAILVQ